MATTNLSEYQPLHIHNADKMTIGIVYAHWNDQITYALRDGAIATLTKEGVKRENISTFEVPGSFELSYGAMRLAESDRYDAVIAIGAVIRGETPHFDFISQGVTFGITEINLRTKTPTIFCVLTTEDQEQAIARSGGIHGNKGVEAAVAALEMIDFKQKL